MSGINQKALNFLNFERLNNSLWGLIESRAEINLKLMHIGINTPEAGRSKLDAKFVTKN
jgi:hypothetical protein